MSKFSGTALGTLIGDADFHRDTVQRPRKRPRSRQTELGRGRQGRWGRSSEQEVGWNVKNLALDSLEVTLGEVASLPVRLEQTGLGQAPFESVQGNAQWLARLRGNGGGLSEGGAIIQEYVSASSG